MCHELDESVFCFVATNYYNQLEKVKRQLLIVPHEYLIKVIEVDKVPRK